MAKKLIITKNFDYDPDVPNVKRGHVTHAYYAKDEPQTLPEADAVFAIEKGFATEFSGEGRQPTGAKAASKTSGEGDGGSKA